MTATPALRAAITAAVPPFCHRRAVSIHIPSVRRSELTAAKTTRSAKLRGGRSICSFWMMEGVPCSC